MIQDKRFSEAEKQCRKLCKANTHDPDSWFMLGGIHAQSDAYTEVIKCCRRVIQLAPQHAAAHYNLGVALSCTGQHNEALAAYQAALRIDPKNTAAHTGIAAVYRTLGRLDEAESYFRLALKQEPGNSHFNNELANLLAGIGRFEEALKLSDHACQLSPQQADFHYNRGVILGHMNRSEEAIGAYRRVIALKHDHLAAYNNLGHILNETGHPDSALTYFRKVLDLSPDSARGHNNIAVALETIGQLGEAEQHYRTAIGIEPDMIEAHTHLGYLLTGSGRFDEALEIFDAAIKKSPENRSAVSGKATALEHLGQYEAAYQILKPVLATGCSDGDIAIAYSIIGKHLGKHEDAIEVCKRALKSPHIPTKGISDMHFALGQLYDQLEDWDSAFEHFNSANCNSPQHFDIHQYKNYITRLIAAYNSEVMGNIPRSSQNSDRPIFIIGMPRSGTSLVEQILCSHPDIFGAGELVEISNIENSLPGFLGTYPDCIQNISQQLCDTLAKRYLDVLKQQSNETRHVIDKMPHNFLALGLINILFPEARVIHLLRDPRDTCISLYFQNFNAMHSYSTDQSLLGQYYCEYQRIMQHWRDTVDIRLKEISYEDLIANQEKVTRELIEFCDLPWNKKCLSFYTSSRFVKTPSYDQVRQPLYSRSIGRWKHYERHLSSLKEALECKK